MLGYVIVQRKRDEGGYEDTFVIINSLSLIGMDIWLSVRRFRGAFAEGDTAEEAIFNCIDVMKMIASCRAE